MIIVKFIVLDTLYSSLIFRHLSVILYWHEKCIILKCEIDRLIYKNYLKNKLKKQ